MATYHPPRFAEEVDCTFTQHPVGLSDSSGRNVVWNFTSADISSVFMTVGDADTFWHPQFFSTVTFCRVSE